MNVTPFFNQLPGVSAVLLGYVILWTKYTICHPIDKFRSCYDENTIVSLIDLPPFINHTYMFSGCSNRPTGFISWFHFMWRWWICEACSAKRWSHHSTSTIKQPKAERGGGGCSMLNKVFLWWMLLIIWYHSICFCPGVLCLWDQGWNSNDGLWSKRRKNVLAILWNLLCIKFVPYMHKSLETCTVCYLVLLARLSMMEGVKL